MPWLSSARALLVLPPPAPPLSEERLVVGGVVGGDLGGPRAGETARAAPRHQGDRRHRAGPGRVLRGRVKGVTVERGPVTSASVCPAPG